MTGFDEPGFETPVPGLHPKQREKTTIIQESLTPLPAGPKLYIMVSSVSKYARYVKEPVLIALTLVD
jgi:hypothetical protein